MGNQSTRHTVNSSHEKFVCRVDHIVLRHCKELTVLFLPSIRTLTFHGICDAINLCCVILILFLILAFILTVYVRTMPLLFMGKLLVHACALLSCYHVLVSVVITVCIFSE